MNNVCSVVFVMLVSMAIGTGTAHAAPFNDNFTSDPLTSGNYHTYLDVGSFTYDSVNDEVDTDKALDPGSGSTIANWPTFTRSASTVDDGETAIAVVRPTEEGAYSNLGLFLTTTPTADERYEDQDIWLAIWFRNNAGTSAAVTEVTMGYSTAPGLGDDVKTVLVAPGGGADLVPGTSYTYEIERDGNDFHLSISQGLSLVANGTINSPFLAGQTLYMGVGESGDEFVPSFESFETKIVPEPATMALLGMGTLATLLRRRARV